METMIKSPAAAYQIKQRLETKTPVSIGIPANSGDLAVFNAYKEKRDGWKKTVVDWGMKFLPESVTTNEGPVFFSRNKLHNAMSHGRGPLKVLTIPHLAKMLIDGILFHTEEDRNDFFFNYAYPVFFDGELHYIIMVVKEDVKNGHRFYDHEFIVKKSTDGPAPATVRSKNAEHLSHPSAGTILQNILSVKQRRRQKLL